MTEKIPTLFLQSLYREILHFVVFKNHFLHQLTSLSYLHQNLKFSKFAESSLEFNQAQYFIVQ